MNELLSDVNAAPKLDVKVATLRAWRRQGKGPAFVKIGRLVRYRASDLELWLERHRVDAETEGGAVRCRDKNP